MQRHNLHFRSRVKIHEDEELRVTGHGYLTIFRPLREIHTTEVT